MLHRKLVTATAGGLILLSLTLPGPPAAAQTGPASGGRTPAFTNPDARGATPSEATVRKAGAALRDVAGIQSRYGQQVQSAGSPDQRRALAQRANQEEVAAVQRHGLSIDQFNQVVQTARVDPGVHQRLLAAAGVP